MVDEPAKDEASCGSSTTAITAIARRHKGDQAKYNKTIIDVSSALPQLWERCANERCVLPELRHLACFSQANAEANHRFTALCLRASKR
jgi:hypothetical protein